MKKLICIILLAVVTALTFCSCRSGKDVSRVFVKGIDGGRYYYPNGFCKRDTVNAYFESKECSELLLWAADSIRDEGSSLTWCDYVATISYTPNETCEQNESFWGRVSVTAIIKSVGADSCNIPVLLLDRGYPCEWYDSFATKDFLCFAQLKGGGWDVQGSTVLSKEFLERLENN